MIFARVIQVGHRLALAHERPKVVPVAEQEQRRDVRREARLVKVDADRIGQPQMADPVGRRGQRPHRAAAEAERVAGKIVVVEHAQAQPITASAWMCGA